MSAPTTSIRSPAAWSGAAPAAAPALSRTIALLALILAILAFMPFRPGFCLRSSGTGMLGRRFNLAGRADFIYSASAARLVPSHAICAKTLMQCLTRALQARYVDGRETIKPLNFRSGLSPFNRGTQKAKSHADQAPVLTVEGQHMNWPARPMFFPLLPHPPPG
jgi:hypothetical protein